MSLILAMCSFSFAMSVSPGPVDFLTLSSGANNGFYKTLPFVSGATIGFTLLLVAIGLGVGGIVQQFPLLLEVLVYAGNAFIAYLGLRLASSGSTIEVSKVKTPRFSSGFLLQWLNPKAWTTCLAGVSAFSSDGSIPSLMLFAGIYFVICYLSIGLWAYAGSKAPRWLTQSARLRLFNLAMGAGLTAVAIFLIVQHSL